MALLDSIALLSGTRHQLHQLARLAEEINVEFAWEYLDGTKWQIMLDFGDRVYVWSSSDPLTDHRHYLNSVITTVDFLLESMYDCLTTPYGNTLT